MSITIITGERNSGKTTTLKNIINSNDNFYLGYISESSSNKDNYYLKNIHSNETIKVMQIQECPHHEKIGKYFIIENSFEIAYISLLKQIDLYVNNNITFVLDEIGALELSSSGFDKLLIRLLEYNNDLIICVRKKFLEEVCSKYKIENFNLINV